jgi:hypothetical protein
MSISERFGIQGGRSLVPLSNPYWRLGKCLQGLTLVEAFSWCHLCAACGPPPQVGINLHEGPHRGRWVLKISKIRKNEVLSGAIVAFSPLMLLATERVADVF